GGRAPQVRKPALDLSDIVRQPCTLISRSIVVRHCDTVTGIPRPRRAVKPQRRVRGAPRGAGLDGESADRAIIMPPRCASSSDIVREIKYRILQIMTVLALSE